MTHAAQLQSRIVEALIAAPGGRMRHRDLAAHLWPRETHPHGWAMILRRELNEMRQAGIAEEVPSESGAADQRLAALLST